MKVLGTSKLSEKGQVTIPREAREKLGVKPGDLIAFVEEDGKIVLKRAELSVK